MHAAHRVVFNTGILYARMLITIFISLYATRLVLAALGAQDFGLFNVVGGTIAMMTFLNTAMASATQRYMSFFQGSGDVEKVKNVFNVSILLHLFIALVILIIMEAAGYFLFHGVFKIASPRIPVAKLIYQFMICSTVFTIISVPYDAVINTHENMLLYSILTIVESLLKLCIAIYVTHTTADKLTIYGVLTASLAIFLLLVRRVYCHKVYQECRINLKKYFNRPLFRDMTGFAGWSFLGSASSILSNYGQGIVINIFFGTAVNAAQAVAVQISAQLSTFAGTMLKALNPIIDKSEGAGNRSLMLKASMFGGKISFFLLMFFYIPVLIEMPFLFKIWLKKGPEFAIIFCRLQLVRNLVEQMFITLVSSIAAVGNIRRYQIFASILGLFPLAVAYLLFRAGYPPYTIYVVFIVYAICSSALILYFTHKNCGLSISFFSENSILRGASSFILTFLLVLLSGYFLIDGVDRVALRCLTNILCFAPIVWYIGFSAEERNKLRWVVKNILQIIRNKIGTVSFRKSSV